MHGWGRGMHGCGGMCMVVGGVHGCGGHAWLEGREACMVAGGHVWLWGGMCGICRDTVNERAVRILLECILILNIFWEGAVTIGD